MTRPIHLIADAKKTFCGIRPTPFFSYPHTAFAPSTIPFQFCRNCKRTRQWKALLASKDIS